MGVIVDGGVDAGAAAAPAPWVVVVGSTMVDLITYVPRVPHAGETMRADGFAQGFGGKGANQAVALALHGLRVAMVACVGDDLFGRETLANLTAFGVEVDHVPVVPGTVSGTAAILVEPSGQNRIALGMGANLALDPTLVHAAFDAFDGDEAGPPAVVVAQLETPQLATAAAFRRARELGATTVLNPGPAAPLLAEVAATCDWVVPNESELAVLLGHDPDHDLGECLQAAPGLGAELEVDLVVTLGAHGALVACRGADAVHVRAPTVGAVDSTGAGDAFVGCFAAGLAGGVEPVRAVERAVAYASDSVTRPGTQTSYRPAGAAGEPSPAT
jgi:ribokinase